MKMLHNIDKAVETAERIATALEQSTVALNKLTAMNEKCMRLIGASFSWAEKMTETYPDKESDEYKAFQEVLAEVKTVWND